MSASAANRLATESSPYLLQHAHNPVDWYPWGEAAFTAARQANKPAEVRVLPAIDTVGLTRDDVPALRDRVRELIRAEVALMKA
jgi:hypothetical protein